MNMQKKEKNFLSVELLLIMTLIFESKSLQASEKWKLKYIFHILPYTSHWFKANCYLPFNIFIWIICCCLCSWWEREEKKTVPISTLLGFQQFRSWLFSTFLLSSRWNELFIPKADFSAVFLLSVFFISGIQSSTRYSIRETLVRPLNTSFSM